MSRLTSQGRPECDKDRDSLCRGTGPSGHSAQLPEAGRHTAVQIPGQVRDAQLPAIGSAPEAPDTARMVDPSGGEVEQRVRLLEEQVIRADAAVVERSLALERAESSLQEARERTLGLVDGNPLPGRRWYRIRVHRNLAMPDAVTLSPQLGRCRRQAERMRPSELCSALDGERGVHQRLAHRIGDLLTAVWLVWFRVPRLRLIASPVLLSVKLFRVVQERIRHHTRGPVYALVMLVSAYVMIMVLFPLGLALYHLAYLLCVVAPAKLLFGPSLENALVPFPELWVAGLVLGVLVLPSLSWPSFVIRRWVLADRMEALVAGARHDVGTAMARRDSARVALDRSIECAERAKRELELAQQRLGEAATAGFSPA